MASLIRISKFHPISIPPLSNHRLPNPNSSVSYSFRTLNPNSAMVLGQNSSIGSPRLRAKQVLAPEIEERGFVDEMRTVAMRLHTRDQAKEGEKPVTAPEETSPAKWEPTGDGYLRFLVDSKLVFETLEWIVEEASVPYYAEFRNTGLERSESLARDLEWFKQQGFTIPEPSSPGRAYAGYLAELSKKDPQAFLCHFYNFYFAHSAGGQMIGNKVAQKILSNKKLEFYNWNGDLRQLLQNVRDKLNKVAKNWSREEKNHCLEETEKSFVYSGEILRLILT